MVHDRSIHSVNGSGDHSNISDNYTKQYLGAHEKERSRMSLSQHFQQGFSQT